LREQAESPKQESNLNSEPMQFRQIVKRCGFILYRNLAKDNTRESWYVTSLGNTRFEVISSMDYLNVIPDWLRRQDLLGSSQSSSTNSTLVAS
jgi:hypothetical protein